MLLCHTILTDTVTSLCPYITMSSLTSDIDAE